MKMFAEIDNPKPENPFNLDGEYVFTNPGFYDIKGDNCILLTLTDGRSNITYFVYNNGEIDPAASSWRKDKAKFRKSNRTVKIIIKNIPLTT